VVEGSHLPHKISALHIDKRHWAVFSTVRRKTSQAHSVKLFEFHTKASILAAPKAVTAVGCQQSVRQ
jgi:hypothetical protein